MLKPGGAGRVLYYDFASPFAHSIIFKALAAVTLGTVLSLSALINRSLCSADADTNCPDPLRHSGHDEINYLSFNQFVI